MANDKIHNKRKAATKASLARKKGNKGVRKRALIVCEDSKSAPAYFKKLRAYYDLSTVDLEICGEQCGSAPISVVKYGESYLKTDADFDFVLFVFDRDEHESFDGAVAKATGLNKNRKYSEIEIKPVTSTPCFELWLKAHKSSSTKAYVRTSKSPAWTLIDDLKQYEEFSAYAKDSSCSYFDSIIGLLSDAKANSKLILQFGLDAGETKFSANPVTLMHEAIQVFEEIAASYKE